MPNEWPKGQRHAHHRLDARRSRDAQALKFREHHTDDAHTYGEDYAAIDEAFTRLDVLERPTTARRLFRLRKLAAARAIRRQYNRDANWLVHNDDHLHRAHRLMLHEKYGEADPGTDGHVLRDEDTARLGPTRDDIDIECDARIDDLRPRMDELLILQAASKPHFPGETDRVTQQIAARATAIERERNRARFLKALSVVRDDYFEPKYWVASVSQALKKYARLAQLGEPATADDVWHSLAIAGLAMSSHHGDVLAVLGAAIHARGLAKTYPIWTDAPADLPDVSVNVTNRQISISWSGSIPSSALLQVTIIQSTGYTMDSPFEVSVTEPRTLNFAGERIAVLTQYDRVPGGGVTAARTAGAFAYVGSLT